MKLNRNPFIMITVPLFLVAALAIFSAVRQPPAASSHGENWIFDAIVLRKREYEALVWCVEEQEYLGGRLCIVPFRSDYNADMIDEGILLRIEWDGSVFDTLPATVANPITVAVIGQADDARYQQAMHDMASFEREYYPFE